MASTEAIERLIRAHRKLFPGQDFDGALHIYLSDDGEGGSVLLYGDTVGCAELDPDCADELAAQLEALDPEDSDLYEVANEIVSNSGAIIEGTASW